MLFNSYEFIFAFLPIVLLVFVLVRAYSVPLALAWIVFASLYFYAFWRPENLMIIVPSILFNFALSKFLLTRRTSNKSAAKLVLSIGIAANLLVLGYFKYVTFFQSSANDIFGTDFVLTYVVLPLGISFITFQKIAFLVDVHAGRIKEFYFRDFVLFILFFPQLIAGPIVHYREMIPQFKGLGRRYDVETLSLGLSLFVLGVFKKVVLADGMAEYASPVYQSAASGELITFIAAWVAALGFTLQIYFDFSGYSDMAAGLALCFGIRLPLNFDSPLKATNIIDFWARWHITLTRFLTAYLYNPIVMNLTRRRLRNGQPTLTPTKFSLSAFLVLLAGPTLLTMFVSGLWHGAGYLFILWGVLHGAYLCINHAWRLLAPAPLREGGTHEQIMNSVGFVLTFLGVVVAMVIFRGPNPAAVEGVLLGMIGGNGISLPSTLMDSLGLGQYLPFVATDTETPFGDFAASLIWVAGLLGIAWFMPNSFDLTAKFQPVLDKERRPSFQILDKYLVWRPSIVWAGVLAILCVITVLRLGGQSEFLYWQF